MIKKEVTWLPVWRAASTASRGSAGRHDRGVERRIYDAIKNPGKHFESDVGR
ncbi:MULTISPECIES: hypothetical protein [Bradyrhizobium]|uniref:hypothetical protein n=1 Tax=Bradyrhizobium centrosematis TaxID=1300039 RepID=UPI00216993EE|nr:hypothetical protein [Bradyrhizobium centrosematis]MCS3765880.1 hypothetical protein [Bradyrhizobium centrosematis]MCS3778218.1 hypothetical protein [Bradyrhizobium centrosematis]